MRPTTVNRLRVSSQNKMYLATALIKGDLFRVFGHAGFLGMFSLIK